MNWSEWTLLALYVTPWLVVIPRAWEATDLAINPPPKWKRVLATALSALIWPIQAGRLLWEEFR